MITETIFLRTEELEAGLRDICDSPKDAGVLRMIVRRARVDVREKLPEGELTLTEGLVGDNWKARGSSRTPDGSANPNCQLTIMNVRVIALLARDAERWPLAGDQLFIDLDMSASNLPPGTRLAIGSAIIEITAPPHTGCRKFQARYGLDALQFVNSPEGRKLNLRGRNAKVVQGGVVRVGDLAGKM